MLLPQLMCTTWDLPISFFQEPTKFGVLGLLKSMGICFRKEYSRFFFMGGISLRAFGSVINDFFFVANSP